MLDIKKLTDSNILLAKQRIEQALKWMLTAGRAKSIKVIVERDIQDFNRMNIKVEVTQPDGLLIVYTEYRTVGLGVRYDYKYEGGKVISLGIAH
jgi:phage gp46-like protein